MPQLWNKIDSRVLKAQIKLDPTRRVTLSFYKYMKVADPQAWRDELFLEWSKMDVLGRIFVAHEGINAQLSVPEMYYNKLKEHIYSYPELNGLRLNKAVDDDGKSFFKLKIKVRNKIVADGINDPNFDPSNTGIHLDAKAFNALAEQQDVVIVDMRNHYESEVGHFENAILPDVDTFRESLPIVADMLQEHKEKHIIMYCTGGIRCEKASAYLKYKGFEKVYQLEGGIIKYANDVKVLGIENKFKGKNFVFDERLGERITDDIIAKCHQCGAPCDTHTNCLNDGCHLLFIQCPTCAEKYQGTCSSACQAIINLPEEEQKALRKGVDKGRQVFKKGRTLKESMANLL
jgi:UPF0176 protein